MREPENNNGYRKAIGCAVPSALRSLPTDSLLSVILTLLTQEARI